MAIDGRTLVARIKSELRIAGMLGDGVVYYWAEVYTDGVGESVNPSGWKYKGYIKKFGVETKTEDEADKAKITLKLSRKPVLYSGIAVVLASGVYGLTFTA